MKYLVILDSGHNEKVQGKQSPDKSLREWDFNNAMQYKIKPRLESHGISVYLTNPSPSGKDEIGLSTRCNLANSYWQKQGKPTSLFVSIHANAHLTEFTSARGTETYVASNASTNSKTAARFVQDEIFSTLKGIDNKALNRGVKTANFTVIYKTSMPSILIEYAFYSNREDLALLKNNKDNMSEATVKAICNYFGIKYEKEESPIENKSTFYRTVAGSYIYKGVAAKKVEELKEMGMDAFIDVFLKDGKNYHRVIAGSYNDKNNAQRQVNVLKKKGYDAFVAVYNK